jgi:hypothetical protein
MKRLISSDPLTGSATYWHYDASTHSFRIENVQDVTDIVEQNKVAQTDGNNGWTKTREMKHVGTIPMCILHQWALEAGVPMASKEMGEVIKKKLNDPDFRAFRTGLGTV